jgi:hypothetical protein
MKMLVARKLIGPSQEALLLLQGNPVEWYKLQQGSPDSLLSTEGASFDEKVYLNQAMQPLEEAPKLYDTHLMQTAGHHEDVISLPSVGLQRGCHVDVQLSVTLWL